ncbi:type IV secretion system protein [Noviherbaspirillum malthae]|uniref:type IV secretion system protein n=1 Tax=Noviherbaspirillum malthae TaxID=1260987 RepID=UPI00188FDE44|nr:type IV secretion system protein [Noviherbaspirillum malthae]
MMPIGLLLRAVTLLLALAITPMANAEEPSSGGFFEGLANTSKAVQTRVSSQAIDSLKTHGLQIAGGLEGKALALGGALALLYLIVRTIQTLGASNESMLQVIFDVALPAMIAAALIKTYSARVGDLSSTLEILRLGAQDPLSNIIQYFTRALDMVTEAMKTAFAKVDVMGNILKLSFPGAQLLDFIATFLIAAAIFVILMMAIAEVAAVVLLGPFLFAIGLAFGPIFIALMVTPWTRDYFGKWIGFMVAAALVTGVAGVAVSIASTLFAGLTSNIPTDTPVAASLAVMTIMIVTVNSILSQVPTIASAMVPGTLGAGGGSGGAQLLKGAQTANKGIKGGASRGGAVAMNAVIKPWLKMRGYI